MNTIIKGQVALLVSMLAAIAITLTACGGGSSSSAGGSGSRNAATVSGTVTNGGIASLEIRQTESLMVAVSDVLIPVARADEPISVTVTCNSVPYQTFTDENGWFSLEISDFTGVCDTQFNGQAGDPIPVKAGQITQVQVVLNGGGAPVVSAKLADPSGNGAQVAGDVNSSDDDSIASADDISSNDGVSDDGESDGASDAESADGNSDGDSSNSQDNV